MQNDSENQKFEDVVRQSKFKVGDKCWYVHDTGSRGELTVKEVLLSKYDKIWTGRYVNCRPEALNVGACEEELFIKKSDAYKSISHRYNEIADHWMQLSRTMYTEALKIEKEENSQNNQNKILEPFSPC